MKVEGKVKYINWETTFPEGEVLLPDAGLNNWKRFLENHFKIYLKINFIALIISSLSLSLQHDR
jgi:hypothetical protein